MAAKKTLGRPRTDEHAERRAKVLSFLMQKFYAQDNHWHLSPADLAAEFGWDLRTARNTLDDITNFIDVIQVEPGNITSGDDYYYKQQLRSHRKLKDAVAKRAAELIEPGTSLACASGTTVALTVRHLIRDHRKFVAIVTNNAGIIDQDVGNCVQLRFLGGHYFSQAHACTGREVVQILEDVRCKTSVIGVSAITAKGSLSAHHSEELPVARAIVSCASESILIVTDVTKLASNDVWEFARIPQLLKEDPTRAIILVTNVPDALARQSDRTKAEAVLGDLEKIKGMRLEVVAGSL